MGAGNGLTLQGRMDSSKVKIYINEDSIRSGHPSPRAFDLGIRARTTTMEIPYLISCFIEIYINTIFWKADTSPTECIGQ